ncbi:MAG TPA: cytochrome c [Terriglobia bacterium]|nr:cytochrome c [Terriglobia bacterium]
MRRFLGIVLPVLFLFASCSRAKQVKENPTFSEDIAPIVFKNCAPCHRPGEAGPFSLLTYEDVRKKARTIAAVTQTRYMPPWPADPSYRHFLGERFLTDEQITLIKNWVATGMPAGDAAKLPPQPQFPKSSYGTPDLVVKMREPVHIPGDSKDRFMVIKIPYEMPSDRYVRAIEFVPGNRKLIHHMNGHIVQYDDKKKDPFQRPDIVDRESTKKLEDTYDAIHLLNDDGSYPELTPSVANYLPGGVTPAGFPNGLGGWKLNRRGAFLMRDIHYGPSPVDTEDQSYFNVFFTDKPPLRPLMELQLGTLGVSEIIPPLIIPPNAEKTFTTEYLVDQDISLLTVNPHMHLLGKSFTAFAATPDGKTIPLVKIPKWDFRWQYFYRFPKMVKIPKGSTIAAIGVYDNTANNPNNPNSPPKTVIGTNGSMRVTDEMFQLIMKYVPYQPGDENISLDSPVQ